MFVRTFIVCVLLLSQSQIYVCAAHAANGVDFDLQGFVDRELHAGKSRVVVPPGRYRVTPHQREHLTLRDLHDVEIVAAGVEMICTETTRAVTVSRCRNVTLRGLTIDYDPLPFTQGKITHLSADKRIHEIELFEGYPHATSAQTFKYEIFRPDTRTLRGDDRYPTKLEVLDDRRLRLTIPGGNASNPEQVGDLIVLGAEYAPHGSAGHAIECQDNVNVCLEDIMLYASNCFGFLESNCDGSIYRRCKIERRAVADDPMPRGDPRLRSLNADAYHSNCAVRGPSYLECTARFMGDDCINIHGEYHMVVASQGKTLRVLANRTMNIRPGDPLEIVQYDGLRLPDAKVVAVEKNGMIAPDEKSFLARQNMHDDFRNARGGALSTAYAITLDREVEIARGGVICSANRVGNGFLVRGCDFGFNRSRGILIKASHGQVIGNRMEGCRMSAVLVTPEYWWLEAGSSNDVTVRGNTIVNCLGIAIAVEARAGNGAIAPAGAHQDIAIIGNQIRGCPRPGILATSVQGLTIEDNRLELTDNVISLPDASHAVKNKDGTIARIYCHP